MLTSHKKYRGKTESLLLPSSPSLFSMRCLSDGCIGDLAQPMVHGDAQFLTKDALSWKRDSWPVSLAHSLCFQMFDCILFAPLCSVLSISLVLSPESLSSQLFPF